MERLDLRLKRLEQRAEDSAICSDPRCGHMELLRLNRCANGLPEYPLPPHQEKEPSGEAARRALAELSSLNRQPSESAQAYAARSPSQRYVDPYTGATGFPIQRT